jgi:hypothetical protein
VSEALFGPSGRERRGIAAAAASAAREGADPSPLHLFAPLPPFVARAPSLGASPKRSRGPGTRNGRAASAPRALRAGGSGRGPQGLLAREGREERGERGEKKTREHQNVPARTGAAGRAVAVMFCRGWRCGRKGGVRAAAWAGRAGDRVAARARKTEILLCCGGGVSSSSSLLSAPRPLLTLDGDVGAGEGHCCFLWGWSV